MNRSVQRSLRGICVKEAAEHSNVGHLIVFPGSGNPDVSPVYAQVYALIQKLACQAGYTHVDCDLRWLGQSEPERFNRENVQRLDTSIQCACGHVRRLNGQPYDILARSYGCWVTLAMILSRIENLPHPNRIILWGPVPFWKAWEMTVRDFAQTKAIMQSKGTNMDETFFQHLRPIESMLRDIDVPTRVVAGSEDQFCSPAFVEYLKAVAGPNTLVQFPELVNGADHEVTEDSGETVVEAYKHALWGAI